MSIPRVVLDTNCLISALIFSRGKFAWLREAWQTKRFTPLASHDTVSELLRVLAHPKFKLTRDGYLPGFVRIAAEDWRNGGDPTLPLRGAPLHGTLERSVELVPTPSGKPGTPR